MESLSFESLPACHRQHSSSGALSKGRSSIPVSPFKMGWPAGADIKAGRHTTIGPIPAL